MTAYITMHEFMADHRRELLALCIEKLKARLPDRDEEELGEGLVALIDEVIGALSRESGLPAVSPLPNDKSEVAAAIGGQRQRRGYDIKYLAFVIGSISEAVGELGAHDDMGFQAREYQVFNQCIDASISYAIEEFWTQARSQQDLETTERVGFLAHELRNALASSRMAFSILRESEVGVRGRTGNVLERSLARMQDLISQTLLAVQLQSGVKPEFKRIHIKDLLHDVQSAAVPERGISIVLETDQDIYLDADERILTSALSNLVQNALKFTRPSGRVVLRARTVPGLVIIEVEDECGGLAPGNRDELFAPFVQRGPDRRGLGLGLTITKEAVQLHGGNIEVRDLPDRGCVFTVRLKSSLNASEASTVCPAVHR